MKVAVDRKPRLSVRDTEESNVQPCRCSLYWSVDRQSQGTEESEGLDKKSCFSAPTPYNMGPTVTINHDGLA